MPISIKRAKELIDDPAVPDEEMEKILDACRSITEILFERWMEERKAKIIS